MALLDRLFRALIRAGPLTIVVALVAIVAIANAATNRSAGCPPSTRRLSSYARWIHSCARY